MMAGSFAANVISISMIFYYSNIVCYVKSILFHFACANISFGVDFPSSIDS